MMSTGCYLMCLGTLLATLGLNNNSGILYVIGCIMINIGLIVSIIKEDEFDEEMKKRKK